MTEITKEELVETNQKVSEMMREIQIDALKKLPLWLRMNWFAHQMNKTLLDKHEETEFNWDFINEMCTNDLGQFDYNMYEPVQTVEEFENQRFNVIAASEGIGHWHKHKCKDCGKEFYMDYSEVHFFEKKGLNLPKRCKECREKRKINQAK